MERDVKGKITEEKKKTKNFVIRCTVEDANQELKSDFMDTVQAYNQEDAKDFVVGWMAERGFIVKKWIMVGDIDKLRNLVRKL